MTTLTRPVTEIGATPRATMRAVLLALLTIAGWTAAEPSQAAVPITALYAQPLVAGSSCEPRGKVRVNSGDGPVQPDRVAAKHADFCVAYSTVGDGGEYSGEIEDDDLKRVEVDTPAGFAGLAAAIPTCPTTGAGGFNASTRDDVGCPAGSQVGAAFSQVRTQVSMPPDAQDPEPNYVHVRIGVPGRVYNLPRGADEVARLGIVLDAKVVSAEQPKVKVLVSIRLRPAPDVGLRAVIDDLPRTAYVYPPADPSYVTEQPIAVDDFSMTLWGRKADHASLPADFAFNGSRCDADEQAAIRATSYDGTPTARSSAPYRLTGCDDPAIRFDPSIGVSTDERRPDRTTATDVAVRFPVSTTPGRVAATVRRTVVRLPEGLALSAQIAGGAAGLRLCSAEAFGETTSAAATCPDGSVVGGVRIVSPAVEGALEGRAFLGPQPAPGELPRLYLEAALGTDPAAQRVKLVGTLSVDAGGRVTAVLDDLPQLPVSDVALRFRGGDDAVFATPESCSSSTAELEATSHAVPGAPAVRSAAYAVSEECGTAGGFAPSISFGLDDANSAGRSSPLTVTLARPDRSERMTSTSVNLPPGMLASIRGVPECSPGDAAAGTCPAATRVGSVVTTAGVGPAPYRVPGDVFLTARRGGAVAGLSFRVPVRLGDLDLGLLAVPADVHLRPEDQGLRVDAAVPLRFKGLPLNVRSLSIRLDRPGFALSPTSCAPLSSTSTVGSASGAAASVTAGLQVSGCERLAFKPAAKVAVFGSTKSGKRPTTQIRIDSAAGSSALRVAAVMLPDGLGFDTRQASRACKQADFVRSACPASARIGGVGGEVTIVDERLTGSLYLLEAERGQLLPGIGIAFQGRFSANLAGRTSIDPKTKRLVSTFPTLPDVPLTRFEVGVDGGPTGVLVASAGLCDRPVGLVATLTGSSGQRITNEARSYCGLKLDAPVPGATGTVRGARSGRPSLSLELSAPTTAGGTKPIRLRRIDIAVPKGWRVDRRRLAKGVRVKVVGAKGRTTVRRSADGRLRIDLQKAGARGARIQARSGALTIGSKKVRRANAALAVATLRYADGTHLRVPVPLTPGKG